MVASSNHDSFVSSGNEGDCADNKISKEEQLNGGHSFFHFLNKTFSRLCSRLKINKLARQGKKVDKWGEWIYIYIYTLIHTHTLYIHYHV